MTLLNWLASADACNKDNMDNTEVDRIKRNGPERVAAAEVKSKKIKLDSTMYDHASYPITNMDITTLMVVMIAVTKICAKMFMPIGFLRW